MKSRLLGILLCGLALPLWAQVERAHDSHVHGTAEVRLAQDGAMVLMEIDLPGMDAVGFEHPPRTAAQEQALAGVVAWLETGDWVVTPERAGCRLLSSEVHGHGFAKESEDRHDHAGPDHGEAETAGSGHSKLHGTLEFECGRPGALAWVELEVFDRFENLERVEVVHFTMAGQGQAILAPGKQRAELEQR